MNYPEILQYLFNKLPMFHRVGPAAYKANLDNSLALSKHFNYPEKSFRSIHVAGTNGKGSVAHMMASVLQEKGYKTGLCTSPHFNDFRERIKINGKLIPKKYVCDFINDNIEFIENLAPSFFELTIAMTFKYFSDKKIDIAVIETGLGGRLDSTNIIEPVLSIITNISLDHTNLLGDTPQEIAQEKAGIIKPGIPVVIGQTQSETVNVFINRAKEHNSPIYFADRDYRVEPAQENLQDHVTSFTYNVTGNDSNYKIETNIGGAYQHNNIATSLQGFDVLNCHYNLNITRPHILNGFKNIINNTGLMGRWQVLNRRPLIICDTGHNTDAIRITVEQLETMHYDNLHLVIGFMNDKDVDNILALLPINAYYYFASANTPRAMQPGVLQEKAKQFHLHGTSYNTVQKAMAKAKEKAKTNDLIFVGGSNFVVGEIL